MGCSLGKPARPGPCQEDPLALKQSIRLEAEVRQLKEEEEEEEKCVVEEEEWNGSDWSHVSFRQINQQKQRDEAAEKWKRLYLSIKKELDQLIQATTLISLPQSEGEQMLCINGLKEELMATETVNKELKAKLVAMERESANLEREVDILRQSLRIMSTNRIKH